MSLHYLGKHEPGNCVFSVRHRHVSSPGECGWLWTEPVTYSKCSKWRPLAFLHARSHPHSPGKDTCLWRKLTEKTQFLGSCFPSSAETLVRRGGKINHRSIAYSLSNISAKNYRNRLMWVESIVCNISVVFSETQCTCKWHVNDVNINRYVMWGLYKHATHFACRLARKNSFRTGSVLKFWAVIIAFS